MTPSPLNAEIEKRLKAATPGPWQWSNEDGGNEQYRLKSMHPEHRLEDIIEVNSGAVYSEYSSDPAYAYVRWENAELIKHAPQDIATLLSELASLRKENERLQTALKNETERCAGIAEEFVLIKGNQEHHIPWFAKAIATAIKGGE